MYLLYGKLQAAKEKSQTIVVLVKVESKLCNDLYLIEIGHSH